MAQRISAAALTKFEGFPRVMVVVTALVIDGLFGIGLARDIDGDYARLVDYANRQRCPVLAIDIPSGLQSDTGRVMGRAVRATHTLTFIGLKPGLLTLDGPDHCGEITLADLGLPAKKTNAWVASRELFQSVLKRRPMDPHALEALELEGRAAVVSDLSMDNTPCAHG